jgi:hypothetical protein
LGRVLKASNAEAVSTAFLPVKTVETVCRFDCGPPGLRPVLMEMLVGNNDSDLVSKQSSDWSAVQPAARTIL